MIRKIIRRIKKKINDTRNINYIKNSGFFDVEYYLKNNIDVKKASRNPIKHYYYNGWKEGRNPSEFFDTIRYIEYVGGVEENPIVHYKKNKKVNPDFFVPYVEKNSANKLIENYFYTSQPLITKVVRDSQNSRLNIIYDNFNRKQFVEKSMNSLLLAVKFCQKYNYRLRIISNDVNTHCFYEFLGNLNMDCNFKVEFFSIDSKMRLGIDTNEPFICTSSNTLESVINTPTITGNIFYNIEENELLKFSNDDKKLRYQNILNNERIIPLFASEDLLEVFKKNEYKCIKNKYICYNLLLNNNIYLKENTFNNKKKYNLLFNADLDNQSSLFYFGLQVLNDALNRGVINPNKWNIYLLSGSHMVPSFTFDNQIGIKRFDDNDEKEYYNSLSNIDIFFSLNYTMKCNYQLQDALALGAVSLTNYVTNVKNNNIVIAQLDVESMLDGLKKAIKLATDMPERKNNYSLLKQNINNENEINKVVDFINNKIGE